MKHINSADFKQQFDDYLDLIREGPVTVYKQSRPLAVFVSVAEYERLVRLEALLHKAVRETTGVAGEHITYNDLIDLLVGRMSQAG